MEEFIKIPYPNFRFSDYIRRKANEFCTYPLRNGFSNSPKQDIELIERKLNDFHTDEDKTQFITIVVNHLTEELQKHVLKCNKAGCQAEEMTQDILYYLYNQLQYYGLETNIETFSQDEIYENNDVINKIIYSLEEIKAGQDIIFTELDIRLIDTVKDEFEDAKGLHVLGKVKWFRYIGGIVMEYVSNKLLEAVFKQKILPLLLSRFAEVGKFLN
jgi:hypothetical protein